MPPTALLNTLESLRRRVRLLSVLYGVGVVVAAAAGLLLATVLVDYLLNLPPIPRIVLMLAGLGCLGYLLVQWVVRPALVRLRLSDVAGKLEHVFPDFNDRLRSTVDFLTKETPGSELMKDRVVAETAEMAGRFNLGNAVRTQPVWQSFAAGAGAVALLLLLAGFLGQDYLSPALTRLLTPFNAMPWPKRVEIRMVADLPERVPVGRAVDVRMRLAKGDRASREARVYYRYGNGRTETEIMSRGADGVYSASLDARLDNAAANGAMTVWIEAGDDVTARKTIAIVQRLAIASAELIVTPPPYVTDEPPTTVALDSAPATVTYGSALTLKVAFNKDLDSSRRPALLPAEQGGKIPDVAWEIPGGSTLMGRWIARDSVNFQVRAYDRDGFVNNDMGLEQVIVRPDQIPTVQITQPARNEECTPLAVIPLRAVAEDDFGIKSLKLVVVRLAEKAVPLATIDLIKESKPVSGAGWTRLEAAGDLRRWQLDFPWDLSQLSPVPLKSGDVIEYHLEAEDNFAFEGQSHPAVSSGKYRIAIMSQEEFASLMRELMGQVREQIKEIGTNQHGLKEETGDLQQQTAKQANFTRADRAAAQELVARQTTAASQAKQSASRLGDLLARMQENQSTAQELKEIAANVRDDLNQVAEHPMKDAAGQVDDAKDRPQPAENRNQELVSAQTNQQNAADRLDQMVSRMGEAAGVDQAIGQLKDILDQQRQIGQKSDEIGLKNLGKRPEQMESPDRKAQQANADAQSALGSKTAKTMQQMNASAQQLEKSDPAEAQAMRQAAQTGQEQNVTAQMQAGAEAQRQNQQASAQQAQAQIEIGLQMMIHQLEEAQRRKLEAIARQLADMQEQINNLVRQQASLNYDNLALRGEAVLKQADAKVIAHLLVLAGWSPGHVPPIPDLDTQVRLQEQAERNTRGVAKAAQSLPDGSSATAALNRAADRMGRAIVALRDDAGTEAQRLSAAYDPPQVEALAALEKAKEVIDAQAAKNDQNLAEQKKDAIRAAYQKILEAQKKIDADTTAVDKAPRGADGQLGHRDAILLGQLPPRQGDLVDDIGKLENDLAGLNSIVYVWANRDIGESMKQVKQALSESRTGVATQAEQVRIEEQLAAMIESLSTKPKQIPFAQQGGGGGGGGGNEPLPREAELRLLKRLQEAVNKATKTIADQAGHAEPALVVLGGRQGQLRDLLDKLLQNASHGRTKLGPEPDAKDKLPEEAGGDQIDDRELEQTLLNGDGSPNPDQMKNDLNLVGQRMARSRQRLANDHDPGKTTQEIQKRILKNLDALIEMARAEEAESKPQPGQQNQQGAQPADAQANAQPNNTTGQQSRNAGSNPAQRSVAGHDVDSSGTPTIDITQSLKEWGSLSPRKRAAVIEAASEKPIQKFKDFVEEYYQALGSKTQ